MDDARDLEEPLVDRRIRSALEAAELRGLGVDLGELATLLPADGPSDPEALARWIQERPEMATVREGEAYLPGRPLPAAAEDEGRARSERYVAESDRLLREEMASIRPLLRTVAVTGSTAYGRPERGEDCDLFTVTRRGTVWIALTFLYLRLRFSRPVRGRDLPEVWCFNYVLDEEAAVEEFARPSGFLFAREALSARPVHGEAYYRGLLGRAGWMQLEAPRLFARWSLGDVPPEPPSAVPIALRAVNALLFLIVGAYLQAVGLVADRRLRSLGRESDRFRTLVGLGRLAVQSRKFDRLHQIYRTSSVTPSGP